jgi:hypothetical protein
MIIILMKLKSVIIKKIKLEEIHLRDQIQNNNFQSILTIDSLLLVHFNIKYRVIKIISKRMMLQRNL